MHTSAWTKQNKERDALPAPYEATAGFEPAHQAFAEPCLTTWPRRRREEIIAADEMSIKT